MPTPNFTIGYHDEYPSGCRFIYPPIQNGNYKVKTDILIPLLGVTTEKEDDVSWTKYTGYIAVRGEYGWTVTKSRVYHGGSYHFPVAYCIDLGSGLRTAFPVDPIMTRTDIEGAQDVYPNADNTAWLFKHSESEDHHDRELLLEGIIDGLFGEVLADANIVLSRLLVGYRLDGSIGDVPTNQKVGALSRFQSLNDFKEAVLSYVRNAERALHIGQHIQERKQYLHQQALTALRETIRWYKSDTAKSAIYGSIKNNIDDIERRLVNVHSYETRWAKAARLAEEAKKRAEAELADANSEETPDDSSSS